jgi:circadian clock protein KaiC
MESTGLPTLDAILGGGLPASSVSVLAGEPGSGKTILTLQLLFHAARQGKTCLYFTTLSEPAVKVIRYMQGFSFFDAALMGERIIFADLGKFIRKGADETLTEIAAHVEQHEPDFVAIDSFRSIGELLRGTMPTMRPFVYDLANQMAGWGATTLLVGEYVPDDFSKFAEFAVADGIIRIGSRRQELTSVRELEILKLRGADYATGVHFFDITSNGLTIYPRVSASDSTEKAPSAGERVGTGVKGLDELLDGGLPRSSSTVVQGGTGTGKTLLGLSFLVEGARHKERGVLYTLEETLDQVRSVARGFGLDLAALEAANLLLIKYASPVELSTDRFLNEVRSEVKQLGARRVVLDSLTSMAMGIPSDRRFKEIVYSLAKHMRSAGISLVMTMESEQLLGSANLSGLGVSFIADNLIQLRYVELEGRLERAISVIKARGIKVNSELRSASIGPDGLTVSSDRFKDLRGVLSGLPSPWSR